VRNFLGIEYIDAYEEQSSANERWYIALAYLSFSLTIPKICRLSSKIFIRKCARIAVVASQEQRHRKLKPVISQVRKSSAGERPDVPSREVYKKHPRKYIIDKIDEMFLRSKNESKQSKSLIID